MLNFIFFFLSLFFVVKSADYAMQSADRLASSLNLSKYLVGFLLVAIISVLPETFISLSAAFQGNPAFGLGTLFGSNVADLTLVLVIIIFVSATPIKVESKLIKNSFLYLGVLLMPIIFGLNGHYSRLEGLALVFLGLLFYLFIFKKNPHPKKKFEGSFSAKELISLLFFMGVLLVSANFTVKFGVDLAVYLKIKPILIGMLFVGLGTTLPELFFSLKAVKEKNHSLAMGDILGTVITDATIVVGLVALVKPFDFSQRIIYLTAMFMLFAAALLFYFMKSGRAVTRKEALFLLFYYLIFVLSEFAAASYFFH